MKFLKSRRGAGMIDLIGAVLILGFTGIVFSSTFPAGFSCSGQANDYKLAAALAQRKMEQLRSLEYESLSYTLLQSAGAIDVDPSSSPYSFTMVDAIDGQLPQGTGSLSITDVSADSRRVRITVSWTAKTGQTRDVQLTTLFVDRRTRRGS